MQPSAKATGAGRALPPFATRPARHEGAILEFVHQSADRVDGYLINPAGLTSEGFAVPHALLETHKPFIEMHMSNIEATRTPPGERRWGR